VETARTVNSTKDYVTSDEASVKFTTGVEPVKININALMN
jgi:hypothetical protein